MVQMMALEFSLNCHYRDISWLYYNSDLYLNDASVYSHMRIAFPQLIPQLVIFHDHMYVVCIS